MKRKICYIFIYLIFFTSYSIYSDSNKDFLMVIQNMSLFIEKCNGEPRIRGIFDFTKDNLQSGTISIEKVSSLSQGDTVRFIISPKPCFQYSPEFIQNSSKNFSLSYSQLIYQMQLAYFIFTNGQSASNMLNHTVIRSIVKTDCFYLMGYFINNSILENKTINVTKYEEAIARAIKDKNFVTISMPLLNCNVNINNQLYTLYTKELTTSYMDSFLQDAFKTYCEKEMTALLAENMDEYTRYSKLMNIQTFYNSGLEIINAFMGENYDINTITNSGLKSGKNIQACGVICQLNNDFISSTSKNIRLNWGLSF